jgi:hypothetical protein
LADEVRRETATFSVLRHADLTTAAEFSEFFADPIPVQQRPAFALGELPVDDFQIGLQNPSPGSLRHMLDDMRCQCLRMM